MDANAGSGALGSMFFPYAENKMESNEVSTMNESAHNNGPEVIVVVASSAEGWPKPNTLEALRPFLVQFLTCTP